MVSKVYSRPQHRLEVHIAVYKRRGFICYKKHILVKITLIINIMWPDTIFTAAAARKPHSYRGFVGKVYIPGEITIKLNVVRNRKSQESFLLYSINNSVL